MPLARTSVYGPDAGLSLTANDAFFFHLLSPRSWICHRSVCHHIVSSSLVSVPYLRAAFPQAQFLSLIHHHKQLASRSAPILSAQGRQWETHTKA
jgi:hypothetical protein